jgi:MATE family multidrug resistance protein
LRLPATYVLCHYFGYDAIAAWWTMSLSTIFSGILTAWAFTKRSAHTLADRRVGERV